MTDYVTTAQIADRLKVTRRTVTDRWTKRPDFPPPARKINRRARWWDWAVIEAWAAGPAGAR